MGGIGQRELGQGSRRRGKRQGWTEDVRDCRVRKQSFLSGLEHRKPSPELPKVLPEDKGDSFLSCSSDILP